METKSISMQIINPNCAGVDVGSRSHFVAIGQGNKDVREFGVYADDLNLLANWLHSEGITSVAMESTGSYWQNLFAELMNSGLEVILTNGKFTKNINRKKTDVMDCQCLPAVCLRRSYSIGATRLRQAGIQKMHTLGLLPSSFLPDETTEKLRTLCRHRAKMISQKAGTSHKMQKYLKWLNFRLDVVVRDVTGLTGIKIISAICNGDLDPKSLAKHRHYNCRKSEQEIAKALVSNGRKDYLFGLKQEYARFKFYQNMIVECDVEIAVFLKQFIDQKVDVVDDLPEQKAYKRQNKNGITGIDLNIISYQYFDGVDLFAITGVSHSTILTLMSEIGPEGLKKFSSAKKFASWLRLAPNNKISGGRTLSNRIPKGSNRLKIALRNAANAVGNLKDSDLGKFFKKIAYRKGRQAAITATARKIAVIVWSMITKKEKYNPTNKYVFLDQKRRAIVQLRKKIAKFGLNPDDLGLFSRPEYAANYGKRTAGNQGFSER